MIADDKIKNIILLSDKLFDGIGKIEISFKTIPVKEGFMFIEIMSEPKVKGWLYGKFALFAIKYNDGSFGLIERTELQSIVEDKCKSREFVPAGGELKSGKLIKLSSGEIFAVMSEEDIPAQRI